MDIDLVLKERYSKSDKRKVLPLDTFISDVVTRSHYDRGEGVIENLQTRLNNTQSLLSKVITLLVEKKIASEEELIDLLSNVDYDIESVKYD